MKREIKFRVWDGVDIRQPDEMSIRLEYTDVAGWNLVPNVSNPTFYIDGESKEGSTFEMLQFTGLTDKHGKEIYEGDIIVYRDQSGSGRERIFPPRPVRWNDELSEFNVSGAMVGGSSYEVIGNIYENPELLKSN